MKVRKTRRSDEVDLNSPRAMKGSKFADCRLRSVKINNPYRPGSGRHMSYQLFQERGRRMTYERYRRLGGRNSHLRHAVAHGYVEADRMVT